METIRIGICDDESKWLESAENSIRRFAAEMKYEIDVYLFKDQAELLKSGVAPFDSVFMDICLETETENGIDVAKKINDMWPECAVVFVTNHLFYAIDSYQAEHLYFVTKDQFEKRLGSIFAKLQHMKKQQQKKLKFEMIGISKKEVILAPNEILYFERNKRRTRIHTVCGIYEIWDKISDIEKRLPEMDFVRCHNSFLVYMPAIREFGSSSIVMKNGDTIAISRHYAAYTQNCFTRWAAAEIL